jgi:HPt (histidine-containing phosphotransfer) domain-containing protein
MNTEQQECLFDLSYLNQVFQGNTEMINEIISLFLEQVPNYISQMEQLVARDELLALHPLAHKSKSSIAMLGLKRMEEKVLQIEHNSRHRENLEDIPGLVAEVRKECDSAYGQLEKFMQD